MAEKKNLCAPISAELHAKVREELERLGMTLGPYVEQVLKEHFEGGKKEMNGKSRTLAFQVSEELFQRIKVYLAAHGGLSQKDFIVGLVEETLKDWEDETAAEAAASMEPPAEESSVEEAPAEEPPTEGSSIEE